MPLSPGFLPAPNYVQVNVRPDVQVAEGAVTVLRLSSDICPVSDFRANAAKIVERVQASRRPMIITQHGRSAAVLLGLEAYESLVDELELLRDVRTAEDQVLAERGRAHASVETRLRTINGR